MIVFKSIFSIFFNATPCDLRSAGRLQERAAKEKNQYVDVDFSVSLTSASDTSSRITEHQEMGQ